MKTYNNPPKQQKKQEPSLKDIRDCMKHDGYKKKSGRIKQVKWGEVRA